MQQVLISLSSFGAAEVRRHGQHWFAQLSLEAGADGVEVRGELLNDAAGELPAIGEAVRTRGGALVYSSPEGLWDAAGVLDRSALERAIVAARLLGAGRLKMSIGGYGPGSAALEGCGVELVVENDQTVAAGSIAAVAGFFADAQAARMPLGMTFDLGNWHWVGECPLEAARACGARVAYVHAKGVQCLPAKWVAVPLADSAAPFRSALRLLPRGLPWAIEYPLAGDDLLAVTRREVALLREVAATLGTLP